MSGGPQHSRQIPLNSPGAFVVPHVDQNPRTRDSRHGLPYPPPRLRYLGLPPSDRMYGEHRRNRAAKNRAGFWAISSAHDVPLRVMPFSALSWCRPLRRVLPAHWHDGDRIGDREGQGIAGASVAALNFNEREQANDVKQRT